MTQTTGRAAVSEAEIAQAYSEALAAATANARGRAGSEYAEALRDAAKDAVMRALDAFNPARGRFRLYCRAVVRLGIRRTIARAAQAHRRRPMVGELPDDLACRPLSATGEVPLPDNVKDLPAELRDAVRFYFVDGFNMDEIALLVGCCKETVRTRLREAAVALAGDETTAPARRRCEKRLQKG